jgi:hypothetical protein
VTHELYGDYTDHSRKSIYDFRREKCASRLLISLLIFLPDFPQHRVSAITTLAELIMAEIKIDKQLFQERLSHFIAAWKADKRSGDAMFGGASSIVVLMGKTEESAQFQKNNAMHVSLSAKDNREGAWGLG